VALATLPHIGTWNLEVTRLGVTMCLYLISLQLFSTEFEAMMPEPDTIHYQFPSFR